MEPYYFMDIELEENQDSIQLHDLLTCYPNGDWSLSSDKYNVIYEKQKYKNIFFNNKSKIMSLTDINNKLITFKLKIDKLI